MSYDPFAPERDPFAPNADLEAAVDAHYTRAPEPVRQQLPNRVPMSMDEVCKLPDDFDPFAGAGIVWNGK